VLSSGRPSATSTCSSIVGSSKRRSTTADGIGITRARLLGSRHRAVEEPARSPSAVAGGSTDRPAAVDRDHLAGAVGRRIRG
jgi:hypothetical protein